MSLELLPYIGALVVILILIPLVVYALVRLLIPDEEPEIAEIAGTPVVEASPGFETLGDFWQSMVPHLVELRDRLVKAMMAVAIGTLVGFWLVNSPVLFGKQLPDLMVAHLTPIGTQLQAIGVGELFLGYMRIALIVGIAIAMPVIVYQLVAFFSPALLAGEKRMLFTSLPFVTELFLTGLAFGWFFTVPAALTFLLGYGQTTNVKTQPTWDSFIDLSTTLLLWNGIIFELPAIIYVLARLGVVSAQMLGAWRRYAIVVITIVAALITPTGDPFNLLLLAVPMYLLFELGILLARLVPPKPRDDSEIEPVATTA
jgi:sec-independent protein translocase protein TatC